MAANKLWSVVFVQLVRPLCAYFLFRTL